MMRQISQRFEMTLLMGGWLHLTVGVVTSILKLCWSIVFAWAVSWPAGWSDVPADVKAIGDYRKDLQAFLQRSKIEDDEIEHVGAIIDLCVLHSEIVLDPRFVSNDRLKSFRAVAAERLKRCHKDLQIRLIRAQRAAKQRGSSSPSRQPSDEMDTRSGSNEQFEELMIPNWLVADFQSMAGISGGPITLWNHTHGNFGPLCDYGPDLVRLIETTISPDSWRTSGGTGVIHYHQPLRILVVNASNVVHDDLTDVLRTMRWISW